METDKQTNCRYIHYGDIHTGTARKITNESKLPMIKSGNYIPLQKGDIVFADASEDYKGIAEPSVILENLPYHVVAGLHTIAIRPNNYDPLFMYYLFTHKNFRKHGYRVGTGMKVFGISENNLLKFNYFYPKYEEQLFIKKLLDSLDNLITLYQRKIQTVLNYKMHIISLHFEKKQNNKIKLSDLELEFSYGVNATAIEYDNENRYLRITDIDESTRKLKSNTLMSADIPQDEIYKYLLQKGDIVFARTGSVGRTYLYDLTDKNIIFAGYLIKTHFKNYELAQFVSHFTLSNSYKRYIHMISQRSIQPGLNINDLKDMKIPNLSNSDMKKINSEINKLNEMLELSYRKLKCFEKLKEYYLNKLFI